TVLRSVTHSSGESDVELFVRLRDGRTAAVLIENKVDAGLQPAQQERYGLRGADYIACGKCEIFRTLVVAPERYFGVDSSTKGFDARLTYEEIDRWFAGQTQMGSRVTYKRALVAAAIEKATLGYQVIADEPMTAFWANYRELVERHAPALNMQGQPGMGRPSTSTFIRFRPDRFPKNMQLI